MKIFVCNCKVESMKEIDTQGLIDFIQNGKKLSYYTCNSSLECQKIKEIICHKPKKEFTIHTEMDLKRFIHKKNNPSYLYLYCCDNDFIFKEQEISGHNETTEERKKPDNEIEGL